MQLILIRHGEPDLSCGNVDPPLSSLGRDQAAITAQWLGTEPIERVVTSPLLRAKQTAEPLARRRGLPLDIVEGVAEVDRWGAEYLSVEELRRDGGEAWSTFLADPVGMLGGNEAQFRAEVMNAVREIASSGKGRTAIATHGLPINLILASTLGLDGLTHFSPRHASICRLHVSPEGELTVLSINESIHLKYGASVAETA